jgi:hypothetical protein
MQYDRNWPEYNKKLIQRGEINLDTHLLKSWDRELKKMNRRKEGHGFEYPDSFILFLGLLKVNFGFSYRKIIGLIKSIAVFCPLLQKIPDYTSLFRRIQSLKLNIVDSIPKSNQPLLISIDGSGLKADHGGSWIEKRFGNKRRSFIKIIFAVDVKSKRVIELSVTTDRVHENKRFRGIIRRAAAKHEITKAAADPGFDDYRNYELGHKKKIRMVIKPKGNSNPANWTLMKDKRKIHRLKQVLLFQKYKFSTWKKKTGYNYRTISESCFSAFKANYGDGVYSKKFKYARQEVMLKTYAYNLSR